MSNHITLILLFFYIQLLLFHYTYVSIAVVWSVLALPTGNKCSHFHGPLIIHGSRFTQLYIFIYAFFSKRYYIYMVYTTLIPKSIKSINRQELWSIQSLILSRGVCVVGRSRCGPLAGETWSKTHHENWPVGWGLIYAWWSVSVEYQMACLYCVDLNSSSRMMNGQMQCYGSLVNSFIY